ncbi:hypothetical protein [Paradesulfitobacterium aromaticivorans]
MTGQCLCGQAIRFAYHRKTARCRKCGVRWERDSDGFWAIGFRAVIFTPKKGVQRDEAGNIQLFREGTGAFGSY